MIFKNLIIIIIIKYIKHIYKIIVKIFIKIPLLRVPKKRKIKKPSSWFRETLEILKNNFTAP